MEARTVRYARFLAEFYSCFFELIDPENKEYKKRFLLELRNYSDVPRKRGEPRNEGCVRELEGIEFDATNPEHAAKLLKEGLHLMYQKQTSKRVLDCLIENLNRK